ncbi:MAG TPA: CBS domain-containing protein [Hyphomicrobiaceae bacterium]|jgi:CBS domain-containing protein
MKVSEVMHPGVHWVEPGTPILEIAKLMRDQDIGSLPVGENDRLVGMVTDRDIVCRGLAEGFDCSTMTARDVMSSGIIYCRDSEELEDAVRIMEQHEVRRLPVINDQKRMVGILSLGDISHAAPRQVSGEVLQSVATPHA